MNGSTGKFSNIKQYPKGTVICREGDRLVREMYILLQGNAGIYKNFALQNQTQVNVLSQGSFHGEMNLFLGKVPDNTLVALSDVIALVVNRKNASEFFSGQSEMTYTLLEDLCKQLDDSRALLQKHELTQTTLSASQTSSLFPEQHGSYLLDLTNSNDEMLYMQKITCPLCGYAFDSLSLLPTKLRMDHTDSKDLRVFYKGIEPLHYEVTTCPNCCMSAPSDQFAGISKRWTEDIARKVGPYRLELEIQTGGQRDTFTVFAGYYLAVLCCSVCFDNYQLITATLWLKLGRLYQDCKDDAMFQYASQKALEDYLYSYENFRVSDKQMQHLCYMIGELYSRKRDYDNARQFFHLAKSNKAGTTVMARQAELRLDEIKELKQKGLG